MGFSCPWTGLGVVVGRVSEACLRLMSESLLVEILTAMQTQWRRETKEVFIFSQSILYFLSFGLVAVSRVPG